MVYVDISKFLKSSSLQKNCTIPNYLIMLLKTPGHLLFFPLIILVKLDIFL